MDKTDALADTADVGDGGEERRVVVPVGCAEIEVRNAEAEAEAVRNYRRNYHCMGRIEGWTVGYHSHYRNF